MMAIFMVIDAVLKSYARYFDILGDLLRDICFVGSGDAF